MQAVAETESLGINVCETLTWATGSASFPVQPLISFNPGEVDVWLFHCTRSETAPMVPAWNHFAHFDGTESSQIGGFFGQGIVLFVLFFTNAACKIRLES